MEESILRIIITIFIIYFFYLIGWSFVRSFLIEYYVRHGYTGRQASKRCRSPIHLIWHMQKDKKQANRSNSNSPKPNTADTDVYTLRELPPSKINIYRRKGAHTHET